ncbi:MAG: M28 family metallopeptidase, partial [Bacteroidia bacterium]|nr:M28 family metallopeptidase [Bacteroidia bacterium]
NGKELRIGRDFIVHESSGSGWARGKAVDVGAGLESDWAAAPRAKGRIAVVSSPSPIRLDERCQIAAMQGATAVVVLEDKLTASLSDQTLPIPVIRVSKSAFDGNIKKVSLSVRAGVRTIEARNVAGVRPGVVRPDSAVILCAHYDHLGRTGEAVFCGANDNASGTALLLSLADAMERPPYTTVFIAFGAEEAGLRGSWHYVARPAPLPLERVKFCLNFDLWGGGEEGVMAVGGKTFTALFDRVAKLNQSIGAVAKLDVRPNAANSDHYPFTQKGVPALFFYAMGGPKHYHDVHDRP